MESTKLKLQTFKEQYVDWICQPRAFLHGGGGPQIGEVTRFAGETRLSVQSLILLWSLSHDRWGDHKSRLPHHSRLPHLPGVPHLNVNSPLETKKERGADMLPGIVSGILNRDFKIQRRHGNENVS